MSFTDVKGYYRRLGLAADASPEEIKRAHRAEVKKTHPDSSAQDDGTAFQSITEAYEVLGDADSRAEYDRICRQAGEARSKAAATGESASPKSDTQRKAERRRHRHRMKRPRPKPAPEPRSAGPAPVRCARCGIISAQPRYVVLRQVIGFVVHSSVRRIEGVFCRPCAEKIAIRASLVTWLLGWWSLPRGPLDTVRALAGNLAGGERPAARNAEILARQARAFAPENRALAGEIALQARAFGGNGGLESLIGAVGQRRLKDRWRVGGWGFIIQALPIGIAVAWLIVQGGLLGLDLLRGAGMGRIVPAPPVALAPRDTTPAPGRRLPETRYVLAGGVALRAGPGRGYRKLADLDRRSAVTVVARETASGWVAVITESGATGFVGADSLSPGAAARDRCAQTVGPRPATGERLTATRTGRLGFALINKRGSDAVVKLRDDAGRTVLSLYLRAGDRATVDDAPGGRFSVEFATGSGFSATCGLFANDMAAYALPNPITLEATRIDEFISRRVELVLPAEGRAVSRLKRIDPDRFAID